MKKSGRKPDERDFGEEGSYPVTKLIVVKNPYVAAKAQPGSS